MTSQDRNAASADRSCFSNYSDGEEIYCVVTVVLVVVLALEPGSGTVT
jgi:hypothetical protein